ncbi:MAG: ATP-dependent helicase [Chloroflexi bacterium]|nr:MAG: ATP-dependent helicase [Chloroflexota bacterium]TMC72499.1 MAG: ATP-dependent helicase [Chloroflexota bacterium]
MPLNIHDIDGPLRVLAGPGTGKTHALVDLYEQAVREGVAGRGRILVLTFSTGAAAELARRIDERLQDDYGEAWISTFHSFCSRLLREHSPDPERLLIDAFQESIVMRGVLSEMESDLLGGLAGVRRSEAFAHDLLTFVALMKQNLVHPSALLLAAEASAGDRLRVLAAAYQAYQERMQRGRMVDFRDLIVGAIELLQSNLALRERLRAHFRLILVDEFQDVDPAQFELLQLLAPPEAHPRLVVVGDPDQSIYGFRGTVPRLLSDDFSAVYGGATQWLEECHRCSQEALDAGERLLSATQPGRQPRRTRAVGASRPRPAVVVAREGDAVDEAFFCAREIKRMRAESPELRLSDFAIVVRSTTVLGGPFEEALRALGLPYEVRGSGAISRNEVVRFLVGYLESLRKPDDPGAFEGALSSSLGGVGARTLSRLRAHAREESRPLTRVVRRLMYVLAARDPQRYPLPWGGEAPVETGSVPDYLEHLAPGELDSLHAAMVARYRLLGRASRLPLAALAYSVLIEDGAMRRLLDLDLDADQRAEAIDDLRAAMDGLERIETVHERLHGVLPLLSDISGSLDALLSAAADDTEAAASRRERAQGPGSVQVLTVHQAKGLEFEVVFCSGFAHGLFPVAARPHPLLEADDRAWLERFKVGFMPSWPSDPDGHLAEEARLAFVAMTRAKRRAYITYADSYLRQAGPSVFLGLAAPEAESRELTRASGRLLPRDVLLAREAEVLIAAHRDGLANGSSGRVVALGLDLAFLTDRDSGEPYEPYGGDRNPEAVEIGHFSPTTLNDYLKCPRLYWYNHHPGLVEEPRSVAMERGGFLHKVLEDFHVHEPDWRPLAPEQQREWLEASLLTHLEPYLSHMEGVLDRKREELQVRTVLGNYIRFVTGLQLIRRLRTLDVERRFHLQLDGVEIVGKIDRVNDVGDGEVEVVDYKTGSGKPMKYAYEAYFGPEMSDVQLALYYLACRFGVDDDGKPLGFQPRFLSLWYPKDWVWRDMRQDIFSVGRTAGLKEYREKVLTNEDLERSRAVVMQAVAGIKGGHFEPGPRELPGTCVTRFGSCPHAAICPYGGAPPE